MKWKCILASAAMAVTLAPSATWADSISMVEGARAKERQGRWLNGQDREQLRRWGGGESYRSGYGYRPYYDGYYGRGPSVRYYGYPY